MSPEPSLKAMEPPSPPAGSKPTVTNHSLHRGEEKRQNPLGFLLWEALEQVQEHGPST